MSKWVCDTGGQAESPRRSSVTGATCRPGPLHPAVFLPTPLDVSLVPALLHICVAPQVAAT